MRRTGNRGELVSAPCPPWWAFTLFVFVILILLMQFIGCSAGLDKSNYSRCKTWPKTRGDIINPGYKLGCLIGSAADKVGEFLDQPL